MKLPIAPLAAMAAVIATSQVWAATEPDALQIKLAVHKVTLVNGQEKQLPADLTKPGDLLEYSAEYHNTGKTPINQAKAVIPVPAQGLEYLPESAFPSVLFASVDGRHFAPVPLMHTVLLPDGRRETRPVPVMAYRYLQWNLGALAPGASTVVKARMKVTQ
jgi:hypothetical protein